jgi:hypothetical protein
VSGRHLQDVTLCSMCVKALLVGLGQMRGSVTYTWEQDPAVQDHVGTWPGCCNTESELQVGLSGSCHGLIQGISEALGWRPCLWVSGACSQDNWRAQ